MLQVCVRDNQLVTHFPSQCPAAATNTVQQRGGLYSTSFLIEILKKTEKILNNTEKYWTILKNTEKYWKNTEQYSKILKNIKKYWKMPWCCQPRGGFYSTSFFKLWHWLGEQCWEWGTNKYLRGQNWDKIVWHIFVHLHDVEDGAQCAVRRRNVFDLFELLTRTETFPCSLRLHKGRLKPLPLGKYDCSKRRIQSDKQHTQWNHFFHLWRSVR